MKKILLSSLFVLLTSVGAYSEVVEINNIFYDLSGTSATVTHDSENNNKYSGNVTIPPSVSWNGETFPVTSIGVNAFSACTSLTSVTIPNSVTSIGDRAFSACTRLTSVTIPESVTSIGRGAFDGCSNLTSVTIPNSVTSIGGYAFYNCSNLTSVTIPESVTTIADNAFSRCSNLPIFDNIRYADTYAIEAVNKEQATYTIKDGTKWIGSEAFYNCSNMTSVTIPNSVTSIGGAAFKYCSSLTSVTIPESVTSIGGAAFKYCSSLISVTIPYSVTTIPDECFFDCRSLTSVTIPNSVTSIGDRAFNDCTRLTSVTIPESVTSIGSGAFLGCTRLTSVTIPNSVTSIGEGAFKGCSSLTSVTIPESVTSIRSSAFLGCSGLTSVTIPESVTSIGGYAFYNCSNLTSVTIPESVTTIADNAFSGCSNLPIFDNIRYADTYAIGAVDREQATYTIKEGTKWIGNMAFYNCSNMPSVTIPNSVTSIGSSAFEGCSSLTSVTIPESVTSIGGDAFYGCSNLPIFDNIRYADTYAIEAVDKEQATYTIKEGTKWIGPVAFYSCSNVTSVTIPNSVTSIGGSAFNECRYLTSVTIPNSVTSIGGYAFYYCSSLTSVTIPESVTSIGSHAFYDCSSLTSVVSYVQEPFSFGDDAFSSIPSNCVLTVPAGTRDAYIAKGWTEKVFKGGIVEMAVDELLDEASTTVPAATAGAEDLLVKRTLKANTWSTICLPFSMTEAQVKAAFGDDVQLAEFVDYEVNYDGDDNVTAITVNFDDVNLGEGFYANYPYLIKVTAPMTEFSVTAKVDPDEENAYAEYDNGRTGKNRKVYGTFKGVLHSGGYVPANDLFLSDNKFYYSRGISTIKAFRAYLNLVDVMPSSSASVAIRINEGTTRVEGLSTPAQTGNAYDLSGRRMLSDKNLEKGVYVIDGQKVVVK